MEDLVRAAHEEMAAEMHQLEIEYRAVLLEAGLRYQAGLEAIQAKFERRLHEASKVLTNTLMDTLRSPKKEPQA